jgi:hypothetical protein
MSSGDYYGNSGQQQPPYGGQQNYPSQPNYAQGNQSGYPQQPNYAQGPPHHQQQQGYPQQPQYGAPQDSYQQQPNYGGSPAPQQQAPYGQPAYGAAPQQQAPYGQQPAYGDNRGAPGQPQGAGFPGPGQEGERGLGATLAGGAGGGFIAHEVRSTISITSTTTAAIKA